MGILTAVDNIHILSVANFFTSKQRLLSNFLLSVAKNFHKEVSQVK